MRAFEIADRSRTRTAQPGLAALRAALNTGRRCSRCPAAATTVRCVAGTTTALCASCARGGSVAAARRRLTVAVGR